MKHKLKTLGLFLSTLYTVCATESGEEAIKTPTAPMTRKAPLFPKTDEKTLSEEKLPLSTSLTPSDPKQAIVEFITGFSNVMSKISDTHAQSVHALDAFMDKHIPTHLLTIVQELQIGHSPQTKEQIIATLKGKTPEALRYENKKVSKATVHKYIETCVTQAFTKQQTQELFSRYVAVLMAMDDQDYYNTLLTSITENYETKGGCWPGVRNRCAISFAYIIAHKIGAL